MNGKKATINPVNANEALVLYKKIILTMEKELSDKIISLVKKREVEGIKKIQTSIK